jgi:hypothetical protein
MLSRRARPQRGGRARRRPPGSRPGGPVARSLRRTQASTERCVRRKQMPLQSSSRSRICAWRNISARSSGLLRPADVFRLIRVIRRGHRSVVCVRRKTPWDEAGPDPSDQPAAARRPSGPDRDWRQSLTGSRTPSPRRRRVAEPSRRPGRRRAGRCRSYRPAAGGSTRCRATTGGGSGRTGRSRAAAG